MTRNRNRARKPAANQNSVNTASTAVKAVPAPGIQKKPVVLSASEIAYNQKIPFIPEESNVSSHSSVTTEYFVLNARRSLHSETGFFIEPHTTMILDCREAPKDQLKYDKHHNLLTVRLHGKDLNKLRNMVAFLFSE